jgi:uncharacterized membrane protein (DUF2068 family)
MRLWPRHWDPETWVCSMRGHATPAASAARVRPEDARLGAELADGRRLARCLRCDAWVEHPVPVGTDVAYEVVPPVAELRLPRRGAPLHQAILMKLISLNKASHAALFWLVAAALAVIQTNLTRLHDWAQKVLKGLGGAVNDTGQQASRGWLDRQLAHLLDLRTTTVRVLLVTALLYAVVETVEAIGLWKEKRWAEYLTVLATAGFLPLEVHELSKRVTVVRIVALVLNVALIVWLVYAKRLFGLRGGAAALHEAERTDWDAVLGPAPAPAGSTRR